MTQLVSLHEAKRRRKAYLAWVIDRLSDALFWGGFCALCAWAAYEIGYSRGLMAGLGGQ